MKTFVALALPLAWLASSHALAQQDHPATEMMAPAQVPMSEEAGIPARSVPAPAGTGRHPPFSSGLSRPGETAYCRLLES